MELFDYQTNKAAAAAQPLAERMRPRRLSEFIGQSHIVGPDGVLRSAIENDRLFSMILWGPPGCGKTTLATIIAHETQSNFVQLSAVLSGVKQIREIIEGARRQQLMQRKRTLLFVDEIHRFNKAQQDAFLPHVESGLITLIGATTENPSFEVISALLSRARVIVLEPLSADHIRRIIDRALENSERGLGRLNMHIRDKAARLLIAAADGDVRTALNTLEIAAGLAEKSASPAPEAGARRAIRLAHIESALQQKALRYDKDGDAHYNLISAFHKSLRGSDPDAASYWLMRMLSAGEDPQYIARRMVRFASEDVGNADPFAIRIALDAAEAFRFLGHPEGSLALLQAAVYLATAPKSNSLYKMEKMLHHAIEESGSLPVPLHLRNAPTRLMKDLGYGRDYQYPHDYPDAYVPCDYLPEKLSGTVYYAPFERGYEKTIKQRLEKWREQKARRRRETGPKPK